MTPRELIDDVIEPNMHAFRQCPASKQAAYNAVLTTDALVGHLYYWCVSHAPQHVSGLVDDDSLRRNLAGKCPNYALIRDLAKALKHGELRNGQPSLLVRKASDVRSGKAAWGDEPFKEIDPRDHIMTPDVRFSDKFRNVNAILERALAFLIEECRQVRAY